MIITCSEDKHLSEGEAAVIRFINSQQAAIHCFSISQIAEHAFVSNATVSRAIRKCGFSTLSEMKLRMSDDGKDSKRAYIINKILSKSYQECMETIGSINIDSVVQIVNLLYSSRMVYILANGLTTLVADEFASQLQYQRINVSVITDIEIMNKMNLLITKEDLLIILSVKNTRPELANAARLAKKKDAKVVSCCCVKGTPLAALSDIALYGYTQSIVPNQAFGSTSRLGLFIITRTIVEYMMTAGE